MPAKTSEDQIRAATVGEPRLLNSTIHLVSYDPAWPATFERQARRIREALGDTVLLLEHVGSTSVPGLTAKPIIDMVLAVPDSAIEAPYVAPLEACGYVLRIREPDWFEHRLLAAPDIDANLHVFSAGCSEIQRMLVFRDWLRTHVDDRKFYQDTKRELAAKTWKYTQHYADAKSDVIQQILEKAGPAS